MAVQSEERGSPSGGGRMARLIGELFWVLAIGVILVYAFFLMLGAMEPGDVAGISILVGVLVVLYGFRAWWQSRHPSEGRDPRIVEARERRGF